MTAEHPHSADHVHDAGCAAQRSRLRASIALPLRPLRWLVVGCLGLAVVGMVLPFSPIPPCPMLTITGVPCPLCGMTRSARSLLHLRACCILVRSDHPRSLGDPENSRSFCRSNTRCGSYCGSRRFVVLEYCVQPDIRVISFSSGKRQTPRRTGAFAKQRVAYQAATAPCASHSSLAAFCT